jgi:putative glutamine amidotransferase
MTRRSCLVHWIAVSPYRMPAGTVGRWADTAKAVSSNYIHALRRAGAVPVVLGGPNDMGASELLSRFDGLLLLGGADVDPSWYVEEPHPDSYGTDRERDRFEIGLIREALEVLRPANPRLPNAL